MGRKSRHSAKTGDKSLYKSRPSDEPSAHDDNNDDDDPMYNEVERFHNRKEEESYLRLDQDVDGGDDSDGSMQDDGITTNREGVFDLGMAGSSDDDDDDDDDEDESESDDEGTPSKKQRRQDASASSSDEEESDSNDEEEDEDKSNRVLNWGAKKSDYYHGDTADLEIGQDVEDAYLEEEAGREVEKARLDAMEEGDFLLDGGDDNDHHDDDDEAEATPSSSSKRKHKKSITASTSDTIIQSITSNKKQRMEKLSKKEKLKLIKSQHPELLPLVSHFRGPVEELMESTLVAGGALLKNGGIGGVGLGKEAEAVGATPSGLQYLVTKSMLQASKALNLSLYLLLKADQISKADASTSLNGGMSFMDDDEGDDIRSHPVIDRLNQLSQLTDKLQENVEDKVSGLKEQLSSLVKASALMDGDDGMSDSSSDDDAETESSDLEDAKNNALDDASDASEMEQPIPNQDAESSSNSDEEEIESEEAIQRRIMNEARFALRNQDIDHDTNKSKSSKRKRRLAPTTSDYGDDNEEVSEKALAAGRKLASTVNSIAQKSATSNQKRNKSVGDEEAGDEDEYEKLQRGLSMMEAEFGGGSDDDQNDLDGEDDEGLGDDDDEDDFYQKIKSKSTSKKEAKKQMYAVAPKYPRLEDDIEGERAIGRYIMQNRGLVAHKPKINRNPRVKKREQYRKALIRRKGAVREIRTEEGHVYGGETTGIKSGISRSRKLGK